MNQIAITIIISLSSWTRTVTSTSTHIPRPCCTNRVFQAVLGEIGGVYVSNASQAIPIDGWNKLYYDYDRKMMALEAHDRSRGNYRTVSIVMDFNKKKEYIVEGGRCTVFQIDEEMQHPCVPGNASYLGTSYFGYGNERVEFVSWEFPSRSGDVVVKLTVSSRHCIPITEAMYGTLRGVKTAVSYSFAEFQPSINDTSVFDVPSVCHRQHTETVTMARHAFEGMRTFSAD